MITAIDSSILLSVFKDEPSASRCLDIMEHAARTGELVICDIVAAEVGALFGLFVDFQGAWMKLAHIFHERIPAYEICALPATSCRQSFGAA